MNEKQCKNMRCEEMHRVGTSLSNNIVKCYISETFCVDCEYKELCNIYQLTKLIKGQE